MGGNGHSHSRAHSPVRLGEPKLRRLDVIKTVFLLAGFITAAVFTTQNLLAYYVDPYAATLCRPTAGRPVLDVETNTTTYPPASCELTSPGKCEGTTTSCGKYIPSDPGLLPPFVVCHVDEETCDLKMVRPRTWPKIFMFMIVMPIAALLCVGWFLYGVRRRQLGKNRHYVDEMPIDTIDRVAWILFAATMVFVWAFALNWVLTVSNRADDLLDQPLSTCTSQTEWDPYDEAVDARTPLCPAVRIYYKPRRKPSGTKGDPPHVGETFECYVLDDCSYGEVQPQTKFVWIGALAGEIGLVALCLCFFAFQMINNAPQAPAPAMMHGVATDTSDTLPAPAAKRHPESLYGHTAGESTATLL